jgi:acyl-coenzyme A synthetase/AMP-(fatty) acid ligase
VGTRSPYAPLLKGCTTILYEGKPVGTPDPGAFWRLIAQHGVNVLFTAPTAFRAIKKEDPQGTHMSQHDLKRFRTLFLAGERSDPDTLLWARAPRRAGDRPLVADGNGLADRRQLRRPRDAPGQARLADEARARV